jgi:hypothetical protein
LVPASIARLVRREQQRRRPGVVHEHDRAVPVRRRGDRRDVLHLEGLRTRGLGEHRRRVRPQQRLDAGAERRVVIGRRDAEGLEHAVAELARRPVDRIRYEEVVAGLEAGHQGERDRGKP